MSKGKMADKVETAASDESSSMASSFLTELFTSPLNIALLGVCAFLLYKIFSGRRQEDPGPPPEPQLPPMKKRDFTLEQLREFDGRGKDGRILIAVNGKVFDMTRGKRFYGPDGPYGVFAGRDASRGLATFSLSADAIKDVYDDLTDLNSQQMESVREWEEQFTEKYDYVGKLLKPGDQPTDYSDTEDEPSTTSTPDKSKDD